MIRLHVAYVVIMVMLRLSCDSVFHDGKYYRGILLQCLIRSAMKHLADLGDYSFRWDRAVVDDVRPEALDAFFRCPDPSPCTA